MKLKRITAPIIGTTMHILHIRVFGKHIFINRYTFKIPFYKKSLEFTQSKIIASQIGRERDQDYKKWFRKNFPRKAELEKQKELATKFITKPLISIIVPTYNPKPGLLKECIESVQNQSYPNWELCIADDASTNKSVRQIITEYAKGDEKIKYVFRETNGHICEASNSALDLATGKYIAFLDHDDYLWPNALYEVVKKINEKPNTDFIYSDEDKVDEESKEHSEPFFKPDWSPEFLRSINYITHFAVIDKKLIDKLGGFRKGYEGAQDWDLFLRVSRVTDKIYHTPKVLYSWRKTAESTAQTPSAKDYAYINQKKALEDDIKSRGLKADLDWQIPFSMWRVKYKIEDKPLVSIIIPTKNQHDIIKQCLVSIKEKTTYANFEIIIVDTGSDDSKVWELYESYTKQLPIKVIKWDKTFNFSSACNFGAKYAKGEYLLFLNNDTKVITPDWIQGMIGYASQNDVGAVGCELLYPNGKLQHGGIILGVGGQEGTPGIAGHFFPAYRLSPSQDPAQLLYDGGTRNFAAVTAACVMIAKNKYEKVKGFDPTFRIAFNDVDFCLKLLKAGYHNVYLPHVQLYHYESISVGKPGDGTRDVNEFAKEINIMLNKWADIIANDPYYHPEFRKDIANARLKI